MRQNKLSIWNSKENEMQIGHDNDFVNILIGMLASIPTWIAAYLYVSPEIVSIFIGLFASFILMVSGKLLDLYLHKKFYNANKNKDDSHRH